MKLLFVTIVAFSISIVATAQTAGDAVTAKISLRMKDSLRLSTSEYNGIDSINRLLQQQKLDVRTHYFVPDSVTRYTQQIEMRRDSLYALILPIDKMSLYRSRKRNLINNN